ncbi:aldehyde dehydrogenase family protein [Phytoactinopolyspora halotolerans]|uniref:Aldehyde dehydrogenase n=1 Tax=Phytoactinopolyspora halotolerans TaxID=1981512 RepID=A0A6L9SDY9_9ACTN|nr:aldehyde dehydrogenase family protein [Phytoactinopolyspora halotolerans]NEE03259.1 aldehyde dehydrogenase [Phytoactinopolyspora halotolerans]
MTREVPVMINGKPSARADRTTIPVRSPSTGERLAMMVCGTSGDVDHAVDAAGRVAPELASMTVRARADLVRRVGDLVAERAGVIARDLAAEQGKPLLEAEAEVATAVTMWHEAAEIARHATEEILPSDDPARRVVVVRRPHGVLAVVTPWNFPATIPTEYLSAGLAAGNAIVWKPSELTPMTALHLYDCIVDAGWPPGSVNLVPGLGHDTGAALISHGRVCAIGFTGSPQTGDAIARAAGAKPMLLELGGNNATVVLDDVDVAVVAERLHAAAFANAGQICSSTERIIVHRRIHDELLDALTEHAASLRLGASLDPETTIGPVNNEPTAAKIDRHLADAIANGARVTIGGRRASGRPTELYYEPTVLTGLTPDMLAFSEETFGPVAALTAFDSDDEAVELVNAHGLGLVTGVLGQDAGRALAIGRRVSAGVVNVGDVATAWQPHTPFGGYSGRASGVGRLGGRYTIEALSQVQTFVLPAHMMP